MGGRRIFLCTLFLNVRDLVLQTCTGPPRYIGWQNCFLGIDSWAPEKKEKFRLCTLVHSIIQYVNCNITNLFTILYKTVIIEDYWFLDLLEFFIPIIFSEFLLSHPFLFFPLDCVLRSIALCLSLKTHSGHLKKNHLLKVLWLSDHLVGGVASTYSIRTDKL